MNHALQSLLEKYDMASAIEWEHALREIVQELALLGLWRSKFYEHAAFYGGTALRIFHGLPRFSEDIDFTLLRPDSRFDLAPHLRAIRVELEAYGFQFEVQRKPKSNTESTIDSAFIKGNTRINMMEIGAPDFLMNQFPDSRKVRIKLELDTDPPAGAETTVETSLVPIPYQVRLYTLPCLFAGKIHAILCRNWKRRVKGRDFYDFVWYLGRNVACALQHLKKRIEQSGHWKPEDDLTGERLKKLLKERFGSVDFIQAADDVRPFLKDPDALALWNADFFVSLADRVETV